MLLEKPSTLSVSGVRPASVAPAPVADLSQQRILFAFNEDNRRLFIPAERSDLAGSGHRRYVDVSTFKSTEEWEECLLGFRPTVLVSCWSTPPLPPSLLHTEALPLRYVSHINGTVRRLVPREFIQHGGVVTNWGTLISQNVAEHALLMVLACLRNMGAWRSSFQRSDEVWGNGPVMKTLALEGKTVGLHGFGGIARALIRLLAPFGVNCLAHSRGVPVALMRDAGVTPCEELSELFRRCDVVISCEALTPYTEKCITREHFELMPDDAVFVNVGRGAVVDEEALLAAAAEGRIRVATDVFTDEPIRPGSPFLENDDILVSPHIAAPTGDWFPRCGDHAMENVERYLLGKPLLGQVTLEVYDRSS